MGCTVGLLLDGLTGHLYLADGDAVSFCAPTVEDWLERELDAPITVHARYGPHEALTAALETERSEERQLQPEVGNPTMAHQERNAGLETKGLRTENLTYDTEDPLEQVARQKWRPAGNRLPIQHAGWRIQKVQYELLRELYALMDLLEAEQRAAEGRSVQEERFFDGLRPLIEAESQLAYLADQIERGLSPLIADMRGISSFLQTDRP
jgi:hypothetical protein